MDRKPPSTEDEWSVLEDFREAVVKKHSELWAKVQDGLLMRTSIKIEKKKR